MKKFFLTIAIWLLGWPIIAGITDTFLPQTVTKVDGKDIETMSNWALLIAFIFSVYLTYLVFKKPKEKIERATNTSNLKKIVMNDGTDVASYLHDGKISPVPKDRLNGFEKIYGPSNKTKRLWVQFLEDERIKFEEDEKNQVRLYVNQHIEALKINWQKSVAEDEYGTKDYEDWIGELKRFFDSINYFPEHISFDDALKIATYEVETSTHLVVLPKDRTVDEKADQIRLIGLVEKHKNALVRNWHKYVEIDDYGTKNLHHWHEEVEKFLSSVSFSSKVIDQDLCSVLITAMVEDLVDGDEIRSVFDFDKVVSAYDFEEKCAEELSRNGWSTKVTSGSGDQGIDVLAEKNLVRVVIQCKLYSKPVGNSAVQQVIAGKAYEKADYAAVVAPNGYTRSAIELAERDGIFLLSPKDLKLLDRYINK